MGEYIREWKTIDQLVGSIWRMSSPGSLFHNSYVGYRFHGHVLYGETLTITEVSNDSGTLARDDDYLAWLKPRLEMHEGFVALRRHWTALGVRGDYTGHDGYGGSAINWGVYVPKESLPHLEQLAQEAVGLHSPKEREQAARDFRIYIARHYEQNWQENQKIMPPIDQSPYARKVE
jgi:hypothetical protein